MDDVRTEDDGVILVRETRGDRHRGSSAAHIERRRAPGKTASWCVRLLGAARASIRRRALRPADVCGARHSPLGRGPLAPLCAARLGDADSQSLAEGRAPDDPARLWHPQQELGCRSPASARCGPGDGARGENVDESGADARGCRADVAVSRCGRGHRRCPARRHDRQACAAGGARPIRSVPGHLAGQAGQYTLGRSADESLWQEKLRENQLRDLGARMTRWSWFDLEQVTPFIRRLEAAGLRRSRSGPR
jgi:hypothetical protein